MLGVKCPISACGHGSLIWGPANVLLRAAVCENRVSSPNPVLPDPDLICAQLQEQTLQACKVARAAAGIVAEGIATGVASVLDGVRDREKELDNLDRAIDQWVSRSSPKPVPSTHANCWPA